MLLSQLTDDQLETYFVRQPQDPGEIQAACRAAQVCCASSLRYGGQDTTIILRLGNTAEFCDYLVVAAGGLIPATAAVAAVSSVTVATFSHVRPTPMPAVRLWRRA